MTTFKNLWNCPPPVMTDWQFDRFMEHLGEFPGMSPEALEIARTTIRDARTAEPETKEIAQYFADMGARLGDTDPEALDDWARNQDINIPAMPPESHLFTFTGKKLEVWPTGKDSFAHYFPSRSEQSFRLSKLHNEAWLTVADAEEAEPTGQQWPANQIECAEIIQAALNNLLMKQQSLTADELNEQIAAFKSLK